MSERPIIQREPFLPEGLHRAPTILVVDDDPTICKLLEFHLKRAGSNVLLAGTGMQALEILKAQPMVDLVVLDLRLPGMSGLETLREINRSGNVTSVIVMTAYGTMEDAITALKEGAYDFVNKSASFDDLRMAIRNALETIGLKEKVLALEARLEEKESGFSEIIGNSEGMGQVMKLVRKVIDSDITVLIQGESGSGKEMVARAIHYYGKNKDKPFVAINCAAIPENLLESELFGHTKGAFTGATSRRVGKFEEAEEGTIFLDEIGEMGHSLQAKLLRVLQSKEIEIIGGQTKKVNVRIISATNLDLGRQVVEGSFRQDLYYRLAVFPITLPPLRQRKDDIPVLLDHFLKKFAGQEEKPVEGIEAETLEKLKNYDWPGNVRELENMVYRAVVLSDTPWLQLKDFPVIALPASEPMSATAPVPPGPPVASGESPAAPSEEAAILEALAACGGNVSKAAERLRMGRATLYRKFKKYGIQPESTDE